MGRCMDGVKGRQGGRGGGEEECEEGREQQVSSAAGWKMEPSNVA